MKIFMSWSGKPSFQIATRIAEWLQLIESSIQPYISELNIPKGSVWFDSISQQLKESNFGLLILTQANITAPWLLFESGALYRGIKENAVVPVLFGVTRESLIDSPLSALQSVNFSKDEMFNLLFQINAAVEFPRTELQLRNLFERFWSELEEDVQKISLEYQHEHESLAAVEIFAESQKSIAPSDNSFYKQLPSAQSVFLLGGTFKTFCDDAKNLRDLRELIERNGTLRILCLNPIGEGIKMLAAMRKDVSKRVSEEKLRMETINSLERMADHIGVADMEKTVKLYNALPRNSIYRADDAYSITIYVHGRGASSPSISLTRRSNNAAFCSSLDHGCDEMWHAESSIPFVSEILDEI